MAEIRIQHFERLAQNIMFLILFSSVAIIIYERLEMRSFLFFLQKTCACGNHGDSKVIVQFYEELENGILDPYCKPPLKTPLCLGALISQKHVLTVKSCFGAKPNEESINEVQVKVKYSH